MLFKKLGTHSKDQLLCLIKRGQGCHCISQCFLFTEASKFEKLTDEISGIVIKGRPTICMFVIQTKHMGVKGSMSNTLGKKKLIIHTKSTKLVIILAEK